MSYEVISVWVERSWQVVVRGCARAAQANRGKEEVEEEDGEGRGLGSVRVVARRRREEMVVEMGGARDVQAREERQRAVVGERGR